MSAPASLDTFINGAIKSFLENPSVESAQLIVGMANTIRENTAPPSSGGCCAEVSPDGDDVEAGPGATAWHEDDLSQGGAVSAALRHATGALTKAETEPALLRESSAVAKAAAADSDTDDEETHGGEMPFYGYEEFPRDYADIGENDDGEAIHDTDEEMYDSDSDDHANDGEVVPMSGIDTWIAECKLSNIHGYKQQPFLLGRFGHVMGEGLLPSGVGCSWLPSQEERNTEWTQCACVRAGKIQLVVAKTPNELCQEHCAGDWCPCPGMQKKWIYRHFGTLDVSHFERQASKELIDMWQLARRVADPDGWVSYGTIREYFSLEDYHAQCHAFYKLRDVWNILMPSNIPENSTSLFQLKPQFR